MQCAAAIATLAVFVSQAIGHSWAEQLQVVSWNGTFIGDYGYPRGYVARTDPGFDGMSDMWLLPTLDSGRTRIDASDYACHPSQRVANYSTEYPMLKVSRGDYVAIKYLENGHVTQPWVQAGKPSGAGVVYVYATVEKDSETRILDVLQWNSHGNGGNRKGRLLTSQYFDDGRCYQMSYSPISLFRQQVHADRVIQGDLASQTEQWCETDFQIPNDMQGSELSIFWVWQWPTSIGTVGAPDGKDEYYTSCLDLEIQGPRFAVPGILPHSAELHTLAQQDPQKSAVESFQSRFGWPASPTVITMGQSLPADLVEAAATPTISTIYQLAPQSYVTSSNMSINSWSLEPQGTLLLLNGKTTAYIDCQTAVTTGSYVPQCT